MKILGNTVGTPMNPEMFGGKGGSGKDGKSAYELAVEQGFNGTLDEWLESLKGEPGKTPEKGVDYWTPEDMAQIVQDVLEALPDGDEVSY